MPPTRENRNGARELAAARQRMIARAGTDNPMDLLPPEVPDADNFFAIPEMVSWREPSSNPDIAGGYATRFPVQRFTGEEPAILEEPGSHRLDLAAWAKNRKIAPGESPAAVLVKELGDGDGTIPRLAEGLTRPAAQTIPCRRRQMAAAGGNAWRAAIPACTNAFGFQKALGIRLRAAALAGDAVRTVDLTGIMLRLGDANRARASDWMLAYCGEGGDEGWRSAADGAARVASEVGPASVAFKLGKFVMPNPRRVLACIVIPAISNIWTTAAQNLFRRRCAVLNCALHRHRLARGAYPEFLESLVPELLTELPVDPAKADEGLHYRREENGFLLWSAGFDRNDDGGNAEKDWTWLHGA